LPSNSPSKKEDGRRIAPFSSSIMITFQMQNTVFGHQSQYLNMFEFFIPCSCKKKMKQKKKEERTKEEKKIRGNCCFVRIFPLL